MGVTCREKVKGSGIYWIFISHQGRRKSVKIGPKKAAMKARDAAAGELALGKLDLEEKKTILCPPFRELALQWRDKIMPAKCKPSTIRANHSLYRVYIEKAPFRDKAVDKITKGEVREYLYGLLVNRSASTVTHVKNTISSILEIAVDHSYIDSNSAKGIAIKKEPPPLDDPYSQEEIDMLLAALKGHKHEVLFSLLIYTGCRYSEALAAQHGDFDFKKRVWNLTRGLSAGKVSTPKSGKGRTVDLGNKIVELLQEVEQVNGIPWLFPNENGNVLTGNNLRKRHWVPLIKKTGLRYLRVHDLRHSFASRLIAAGVNLYYIQRMLGHSDIQILISRYAHLLPDSNGTKPLDILD